MVQVSKQYLWKNETLWTIQTVSIKFWLCVKKYLIKFLSNFLSIREKIQTPSTIRFNVLKNTSMKIFLWRKKHKFLHLAIISKKNLRHSQNFTGTFWEVQGVFFTDTVWIIFWDIEKWKMDSWTTWTGYKYLTQQVCFAS